MHLSGSNILIVGEAPGTLDLRESLIASGANVQVVSVAGASIVIRQKQIDGAFIGASLDEDTRQLCAELSALEIAQIFIAPEFLGVCMRLSLRASASTAYAARCGHLPSPDLTSIAVSARWRSWHDCGGAGGRPGAAATSQMSASLEQPLAIVLAPHPAL